MKRKPASPFASTTLEIPPISKTLPRNFTPRQTKKRPVLYKPEPPGEDWVNYLNTIGKEYPFCVYYKQKLNDPL